MEIVLVRHGKPASALNQKMNAAGFARWVRRYNHSLVSDFSRPELDIGASFPNHFVVASDLPRALHSCAIATGNQAEYVSKLYREMAIPRYKLPLTLRAWSWVYLNRLFWLLGKPGHFETYLQAKNRAHEAACELADLAQQHNKVLLFAHGFLNLHIRRNLQKAGWQLKDASNNYWGVTRLSCHSVKR